MSHPILEKIKLFDVADWLGIITLAMEQGEIQTVEISSDMIAQARFGKRLLSIRSRPEGGFSMTFISPEEVQDMDIHIEPLSHTLN